MVGGLEGQLKSAGYEIKRSGGGLQASIEDEEENNDPIPINGAEVDKYIKLTKGSLSDILRIGSEVLKKN